MQTTINPSSFTAPPLPLSFLLTDYANSPEARAPADQCVPSALYWDTNAVIRTESTDNVDCLAIKWQPVSLTVTCDAIYVQRPSDYAKPGMVDGADAPQKISKFRIMRRWNEDTDRGTAIKLRYRDDHRDVHEIEVTPSDRCRFLTALAVGVD